MNIFKKDFSEAAYRAFTGTSFSPERRAENTLSEFSEQLTEDLAELEKAGVSQEDRTSYQARYEQHFGTWLGKKSNCISSMIAGPSKFPVRRAEKANRSEENHYQLWQAWRKKAMKAIVRNSQPAKTYSSEVERYEAELKDLVRSQEYMKIVNAAYRAYKKNPASLDTSKIHSSAKDYVRSWVPPYSYVKQPFTYQLQNNLANIKRVEGRISELKAKEAQKEAATGGQKEIAFEGGVLVLNYELDRVQIKFPSKPASEVIRNLKSGGFRWAPSQMSWQRQLTGNGLYSASRFTGIAIDNLK